MKDRESLYPGRVKMTPVEGQENIYDLERADEPTVEGTALNKRNLLPDYVAEALGLKAADDPAPADAFRAIAEGIEPLIETIGVAESGDTITAVLALDNGEKLSVVTKFDSEGKATEIAVNGRTVPVSWEVEG